MLFNKPLSVLLFKEGSDTYVAQCLEYDVCGAGKTLQEAIISLLLLMEGYEVLSHDDKVELVPAPGLYYKSYSQAKYYETDIPMKYDINFRLYKKKEVDNAFTDSENE